MSAHAMPIETVTTRDHLRVPGLTFYLAARYSRREELVGYAATLEARGHRVPARWLLGEHQVHGVEAARVVEQDGPVPVEQAVLFARDDVEDILEADVLVAFTEPPRQAGGTRGGRHVELGIALGLRYGASSSWPRIFTVGPLENVFHAVDEIDGRFGTWDELLDAHDALPSIHGWAPNGNDRCDQHPWHGTNAYHERFYGSAVAS